MKTLLKIESLYLAIMLLAILTSCEDFLDADNPFGQIPPLEVFNDETTATAAVTSIYAKLRDQNLLNGNSVGLSISMGLYADELDYFGTPGQSSDFFYNHQITASDPLVNHFWSGADLIIYLTNSVIEGLSISSNLTNEAKNQLTGEALFTRGLIHFYLTNLFGDIPYITSTDYTINSTISRLPQNEVYQHIITDLNQSRSLLGNTYISQDRTRPNKATVAALLSRLYLYLEQWQLAETESSSIINNSSLYLLENVINSEFLRESPSTIWHFSPKNSGDNTLEAQNFIFTMGPPPFLALNQELILDMEPGDLRRTYWIGEVTDGTATWYFPYKYKQNTNTDNSLEYSVVFRLAEQYLIRAEAKARTGDITGAQQDLNVIRNRAGLPDTEAQTADDLLTAILNERRFELFTEHGHRWFDIKRMDKTGEILSPVKPGWRPTNVLLPIPEQELLMNPNLDPQNPGY